MFRFLKEKFKKNDDGRAETETSFRVGDLAYNKIYEGNVKPFNVFRVCRVHSDGRLLVRHTQRVEDGWSFKDRDTIHHESIRFPEDCIPISKEEFKKIVDEYDKPLKK